MVKKKKVSKKRAEIARNEELTKFVKIRKLKCYPQVEEMLYAGYPVSAVCVYIQDRMKEYPEIKRTSLIERLSLFRQSLSEGGLVHSTLPRVFVQAEKKFSNKMMELERLEDSFSAMEYRFDVAHAEERINGKIDPQVDRIGKSMRDIVMQMHNIKMDLGLVGSRDLGTITVSAEKIAYIKDKYGEGAAKAFQDPVSRGRVLAALGAIKRAGNLRDTDGEPMELGDRMDLSDAEKSRIVDVEYEVAEGDDVPEGDDGGEDAGDSENGQQGTEFMPQGEDLNKPSDDMPEGDMPEGYDEVVEALDPDEEPEEGSQPVVRRDPQNNIEMAPVRKREGRLPPGPIKPSVRGNVERRWSSTDVPKKDPQ